MVALSLRHQLRKETSAVHERLHRHDHFSAIADGSIAAGDFEHLMAWMGSFYAALDPLMQAACLRSHEANPDYTYRPRAPMFRRIHSVAPDLPEIDGLPELAGAAYVVDGAVLGGQLLRRAISGRLAHPYWDWCAEQGPSVWRDTRSLIEHADSGQDSADRAVATANYVFQAFSDHMNMARSGVTA